MAGLTYTGVYPTVANVTTSFAAGTTRWNVTTNQFEMYDGQNWVAVSTGSERMESMYEMVERIDDYIATTIEVDYKDNVTLQDAYKTWEEANERFKVILALAEKK